MKIFESWSIKIEINNVGAGDLVVQSRATLSSSKSIFRKISFISFHPFHNGGISIEYWICG